MRRVLVTGATGFLGARVLAPLQARGFEIHVAGRSPPKCQQVVFYQADMLQTEQLRSAVQSARATHLLHLAWYAEPGQFWGSPLNLDWVSASLNLVRTFVETGEKRPVRERCHLRPSLWSGISDESWPAAAGFHACLRRCKRFCRAPWTKAPGCHSAGVVTFDKRHFLSEVWPFPCLDRLENQPKSDLEAGDTTVGSSLFGRLRSSTFRLFTSPMFVVTRGFSLLFGISSSALPVWDQEDEAAQSRSRSDRGRLDRHKTLDLPLFSGEPLSLG